RSQATMEQLTFRDVAIDFSRTRPKEGWKGPRSDSSKSNKIFVVGIPHICGDTELRDYFK
ncbi:hypothetical protein, partial [Salmonella enterica]|uniref:hypothetical protein n=1 Tax=Salmonella enterica TaxID=28901 RepID=UPI003297608F